MINHLLQRGLELAHTESLLLNFYFVLFNLVLPKSFQKYGVAPADVNRAVCLVGMRKQEFSNQCIRRASGDVTAKRC